MIRLEWDCIQPLYIYEYVSANPVFTKIKAMSELVTEVDTVHRWASLTRNLTS